MISRKILLIDRIATLVLGLALVAGGALGLWWWSGDSPFVSVSDTGAVQRVVDMVWWPTASVAVGVLLILLGLRWAAAHLSRAKVDKLYLPGSGSQGKLDVDGSKVVGAAADVLADTLGVRSATGKIMRDRGQLVARIDAVIEPEADLGQIAESADLVSAQLAEVLGRDDLRCSVELRVARAGRQLSRAF